MELTIRQQIYYSNEKLIPINEIAESLLALEGIIKQSPSVLEGLFPGTKIDVVEVYIEQLKSDSLWEDVVVKLIFGDQKSFDEFISSVRERIGMEKFMNNPQLFSAIILALIFAGGAFYLGRSTIATPEHKASIEANNNTIIQIGAGLVELEAEGFMAVIDSAIKDKNKNKLAKDAITLIKPAKRDPGATITFNDNEDLQINNDSVKAMPSYFEEPEKKQEMQDFHNIELVIRATDLDNSKKGWGARIPDLYPKRIRMQLDPSVDPEELGNRTTVIGDVTVLFDYNKDNNKIPKIVFLREIKD